MLKHSPFELPTLLHIVWLSSVLTAGCVPPAPEVDPAPAAIAEPTAATGPDKGTAAGAPVPLPGGAASRQAPPAAATNQTAQVPYYNPLTEEEWSNGWINLFDGQSLFGWVSNEPAVNWQVQDGCITSDSGPKGLLLTSVPFSDFELRGSFEMEAGGNSGVFLRTLFQPVTVDQDCYELNMVDEHPAGYLTGSFVGRQQAVAPLPGSGGWKTFRVLAQGRHFEVYINDELVLDYTDETESFRPSGLIGLQRNAGRVAFRDLRLKPLSLDPLFNGQDLRGWQVVPGSKSEFKVEEGTIRVLNGPGFLETTSSFGDFIIQVDALTHAPNLNSGFFFRAQPGTEEAPSNGYEVQIDNSLIDGDRYHPANQGTGAIFRPGIPARYVVSSDGEWCTITLIAHGPQLAVWVNGYHVLNWEDTRTPNDNPRRGLRTAAGRISLQGHDPTTDVSFRRIVARETPVTAAP
jgi:hypothetical protein